MKNKNVNKRMSLMGIKMRLCMLRKKIVTQNKES